MNKYDDADKNNGKIVAKSDVYEKEEQRNRFIELLYKSDKEKILKTIKYIENKYLKDTR